MVAKIALLSQELLQKTFRHSSHQRNFKVIRNQIITIHFLAQGATIVKFTTISRGCLISAVAFCVPDAYLPSL